MKTILSIISLLIIPAFCGETTLEDAHKTKALFENFTFSWTAIHGNPDENHIEVDVLHAPGKARLTLYVEEKGARSFICETIIINDSWYLTESGKSFKYRPYEAHFSMPDAYYYLMKSKVQFITKNNMRLLGNFTGVKNDKLHFHRNISISEIDEIRQRVDLIKTRLIPHCKNLEEKNLYLKEIKQLLDSAKNGKLNKVDKETGVISTLDMVDGIVRIKNFQWLTNPQSDLFNLPQEYTDLSDGADFKEFYFFGFSEIWQPGSLNKLTDGRILNVKTGSLRRLPFKGSYCTPYDTDPQKNIVYVAGRGINSSSISPYALNLLTGENTMLGTSVLQKGVCSSLTLSPDKKTLALLHKPAASVTETNSLIVIKLADNSMKILKLQTAAQKVIWHPDGKSLFISYLNKQAKQSIISLIKLGKPANDILEGASPQILPGGKRLLFMDLKDGLWKSAKLDGSGISLFHNGLPNMQSPRPDPITGNLLLIMKNEDDFPIPALYNPETKMLKKITKRRGLWLSAVAAGKE